MTQPKKCPPSRSFCSGLLLLTTVFGLALTVFGIQSVGIAKQTDRLITRVEVLENVQMTVAVNSKTLSAIESNLAYIRDRVDKLREREEQK